MTATHPSLLVEGPYAIYDFPTSILWAAAMVNFKTYKQTRRQSNGIWNGNQHRKEQSHAKQHEQHQCRYHYERPGIRGGDQFQIPGGDPV